MKRILSVVAAVALAGCGGASLTFGGGNLEGNVRVDDPTGVLTAVDATGINERGDRFHVRENGLAVRLSDTGLLGEARTLAFGRGSAQVTYTRTSPHGGFERYQVTVTATVPELNESSTIEGYGAWGEHNAFEVLGITRDQELVPSDRLEFSANSGGRLSGSNPVGTTGTATWRGTMLGESGDNFLSGDSTLVYDFSAATVDVRLSNMRALRTTQTYSDLVWDSLTVLNGAFGTALSGRISEGSLTGSFYGPNHEEAGGVFDRNQITGAFGAKREP